MVIKQGSSYDKVPPCPDIPYRRLQYQQGNSNIKVNLKIPAVPTGNNVWYIGYMQFESEARRDGIDLEYEHSMQEQSERENRNASESYDAESALVFVSVSPRRMMRDMYESLTCIDLDYEHEMQRKHCSWIERAGGQGTNHLLHRRWVLTNSNDEILLRVASNGPTCISVHTYVRNMSDEARVHAHHPFVAMIYLLGNAETSSTVYVSASFLRTCTSLTSCATMPNPFRQVEEMLQFESSWDTIFGSPQSCSASSMRSHRKVADCGKKRSEDSQFEDLGLTMTHDRPIVTTQLWLPLLVPLLAPITAHTHLAIATVKIVTCLPVPMLTAYETDCILSGMQESMS
eukprot:scaffold72368_cov61-Attheya_sp.AAC.4